jgi:hypothetical protein
MFQQFKHLDQMFWVNRSIKRLLTHPIVLPSAQIFTGARLVHLQHLRQLPSCSVIFHEGYSCIVNHSMHVILLSSCD